MSVLEAGVSNYKSGENITKGMYNKVEESLKENAITSIFPEIGTVPVFEIAYNVFAGGEGASMHEKLKGAWTKTFTGLTTELIVAAIATYAIERVPKLNIYGHSYKDGVSTIKVGLDKRISDETISKTIEYPEYQSKMTEYKNQFHQSAENVNDTHNFVRRQILIENDNKKMDLANECAYMKEQVKADCDIMREQVNNKYDAEITQMNNNFSEGKLTFEECLDKVSEIETARENDIKEIDTYQEQQNKAIDAYQEEKNKEIDMDTKEKLNANEETRERAVEGSYNTFVGQEAELDKEAQKANEQAAINNENEGQATGNNGPEQSNDGPEQSNDGPGIER